VCQENSYLGPPKHFPSAKGWSLNICYSSAHERLTSTLVCMFSHLVSEGNVLIGWQSYLQDVLIHAASRFLAREAGDDALGIIPALCNQLRAGFPCCYLPLPWEERCCELTSAAGQASSSGGRSSPTFKAGLWKDLSSSGFPLSLDWRHSKSSANSLQLPKCALLPREGLVVTCRRWLKGQDTTLTSPSTSMAFLVVSEQPQNHQDNAKYYGLFWVSHLHLLLFFVTSMSITYHRIIEWFGLEGTFKIIQFQAPAIGRDTLLWLRLLFLISSPSPAKGLKGAVNVTEGQFITWILSTLRMETVSLTPTECRTLGGVGSLLVVLEVQFYVVWPYTRALSSPPSCHQVINLHQKEFCNHTFISNMLEIIPELSVLWNVFCFLSSSQPEVPAGSNASLANSLGKEAPRKKVMRCPGVCVTWMFKFGLSYMKLFGVLSLLPSLYLSSSIFLL